VPGRAVSKGRVLVVDDEPANVTLMAARLRAFGYEVHEAASGEEALRLLRQWPMDLVLSDVRMPGIDGCELVRRIRADASLGGPPVVLVTGYDGPEERAQGLDAGADDFLTKPIQLPELQLRVHAQVRLHRLHRELRHRGRVLGAPAAVDEPVRGGRVFVIEDDVQWSALLIETLRTAGHEVESAVDLRTGIAGIARFEPDVILVDLKLPDGDGSEVIRRFHHVGTGRPTPVIVVVTAASDEEEKVACLRLGADDFVAKPISPMELVARVASQLRRLSAAVLAASQVERAIGDAYTDPLTGLYNRRYLDADLERRVGAAGVSGEGFAIALLDVDHFKRINDTWGHAAGDAVLRTVAQQIRAFLRTGDLECRYGGEEFVIVLPETTMEGATSLAETLREKVAAHSFVFQGESIPVTISVGCALVQPNDAATELIQRADEKLYEAKRSGRNRVCA